MKPDMTLAQAYVLRAQLDVLIAMLEGPAPEGCQHPEEKRLDTSVGGGPPTFFCRACEKEVEGVA